MKMVLTISWKRLDTYLVNFELVRRTPYDELVCIVYAGTALRQVKETIKVIIQ